MTTKKEQRIKLQLVGSPVKLDATIKNFLPHGRAMEVCFDGPIPDMWLYAWGETLFVDRQLKDGEAPVQFPDVQLFRVV